MSKVIAFLGVAACLGVALPTTAGAADFYDGGDRPLAFHSRDDVYIDGGRARVEHSQDLRPAYRGPRGPGPVVFDERNPARFYGEPAYGEPRLRPPAPIGQGYGQGYGYGYGRPAAFVPQAERFYGDEDGTRSRPAPYYRPAGVPEFDGRDGRPDFGRPDFGHPDGGCTVEQAQSTTPYGWRKIVTHRTCYRR